jgi:hypothetical protein
MADRRTATLQVGDLALRIEAPLAWIERLGRLWRGWMGNSAVEPWTVSAMPGDPVPNTRPLFEARPRFTDGICRLDAPGFAGWIDSVRGAAHLEAHPAAGAGDLALFVRTCLALQAFERGEILFHAAGTVRRGRGYALFGLSGSGKTTAAGFSPDGVVLNDDLVLVRPAGTGWEVAATPFGGGRRPEPRSAPLRALLRLVQAPQDRLEPLGPGAALGELVANSPVVNADVARLPALLARWGAVLAAVPIRALYFRRAATFWEVVDAELG